MRIAQAAAEMLDKTLLPFWTALRDDEHGGYYGYVDYGLRVHRDAEKGCILNSRILWFFSEAARLTGREALRTHAAHAYRFLTECCLDRENGGVYWSVTHDGRPLDTTKHTYNQAFAVYALSAYYRLTGDAAALALARELFGVIERRCADAGGYREAFTADWRDAENDKLSENGVLAARTMNTLLHVFEGYAGLYAAAPDAAVEAAMRRILAIYAEKLYDPALRRQLVFMDEGYNSLIDLYSYGHDIEASWLIDQGTLLLGDGRLTGKIAAINSALAAHVYEAALRDGSLANECERGVVDETRVWWVQAEGVLGFVNEFEKSGDGRYARAAAELYRFIRERLVDKRPGGEWFWQTDARGVPAQKPIVEPWKCPYHNGRMCMELMRRDPDVEV